jgi:hypothetical protein
MTVGLGAMTLLLGLFTCVVQTTNHERAHQLAELQREWEMLEAANAQRAAVAGAHVWGSANQVREDGEVGGGVRP